MAAQTTTTNGTHSTPSHPNKAVSKDTTVAYIPTTGVEKLFTVPVITATPENLKGYGHLVSNPSDQPIEIVRWPAQGWRPVDTNSGDQGGTTEGIFEFWWKGDTLYARNNAVGDSYLFAWSALPEQARSEGTPDRTLREKALIFHANYHSDGGQMFFPLDGETEFVVPLALPGDDVTPEKFVAFKVEGLYMHPNVWHGSVVPYADECRLLDRQGKVHAQVSVDFVKEFGGYLAVPLQ